MKAAYVLVTGVALLLASLLIQAQEAPPAQPPEQLSTPAPVAIMGTDEPLSCAYCDLRGKDLAGKNLKDANLIGSDLREAKLAGATLDGAILSEANLAGADLSGAHLGPTSKGPADLTRANLDAANFSHAVLTDAQLVFADLEGTDFKGANLTGAVLGPHPNIGTSGGRRTSFRDARMDRRWTEAATAADVQGVIWNKPKALRKSNLTAGLTCGGSDVSGVKNPVYVSSSQGTDNTSCGASPTVACKSLAYALTRCTSNGCNVLAMYDQFVLPATLVFDSHTTPAGAQLYGGCLASGPTNGLTSEIVAPSGGAPAVSIAGVKPVVLENFKILGSAATASKGVPAVTAQIAQGSQVTVTNSLVVGGQGGTGGPGAQQPPGTKGGDASQQTAGTNASCSNTNGGTGASEMVDKGTYTECVGKCATPGCSGAYGAPGTTPKWAAGGNMGKLSARFARPGRQTMAPVLTQAKTRVAALAARHPPTLLAALMGLHGAREREAEETLAETAAAAVAAARVESCVGFAFSLGGITTVQAEAVAAPEAVADRPHPADSRAEDHSESWWRRGRLSPSITRAWSRAVVATAALEASEATAVPRALVPSGPAAAATDITAEKAAMAEKAGLAAQGVAAQAVTADPPQRWR